MLEGELEPLCSTRSVAPTGVREPPSPGRRRRGGDGSADWSLVEAGGARMQAGPRCAGRRRPWWCGPGRWGRSRWRCRRGGGVTRQPSRCLMRWCRRHRQIRLVGGGGPVRPGSDVVEVAEAGGDVAAGEAAAPVALPDQRDQRGRVAGTSRLVVWSSSAPLPGWQARVTVCGVQAPRRPRRGTPGHQHRLPAGAHRHLDQVVGRPGARAPNRSTVFASPVARRAHASPVRVAEPWRAGAGVAGRCPAVGAGVRPGRRRLVWSRVVG